MRVLVVAVYLLLCTFFAGVTFAHQDIEQHRSCEYCGMDRKVYGYSRALVVYEDGGQTAVCSLHCAVTELNAHKEKKLKQLLVADRDSHQLIDVEDATWVTGGNKRGVMTHRPKWAFASKKGAQAFIDSNGGTIITWSETLSAAKEDAAPNRR